MRVPLHRGRRLQVEPVEHRRASVGQEDIGVGQEILEARPVPFLP